MRKISPHKLVELLVLHFGGDEHEALRFMRAFPSVTLVIPNEEKTEQIARERHIVRRINRDPETNSVRRLADFHSIGMRAVVKTFSTATGRSVAQMRANSGRPQQTEAAPAKTRRFRPVGIFRSPMHIRDCPGQLMLF